MADATAPLDFAVDGIFVSADVNVINSRSVAGSSPFFVTEADGSALKVAKGGIRCEKCGAEFGKFSELYKHTAVPCPPREVKEDGDVVRICFARSNLPFVEKLLSAAGKEVHEAGDDVLYVTHPRATHEFFLNQIYYSQCNMYNLEGWYGRLRERIDAMCVPPVPPDAPYVPTLTADSRFVELSDAELIAIQKLYTRGEFSNTVSREENAAASALERRIADAMAATGWRETFVRLSTRSAKDSAEGRKEKEEADAAKKLQNKAAGLRVRSAREVVELLSKSMRIYSDIGMYFKFRMPGAPGEKMNLILRRWVTDMPNEMEFRCFVKDRRITAISQYYCYDAFPVLQDEALVLSLRDRIVAFHDALGDVFEFPSYVLDVCVQGDQIHIIELNPFGAHLSSGAALFDWTRDRDLLYGETPTPDGKAAVRVLKELRGKHVITRSGPNVFI